MKKKVGLIFIIFLLVIDVCFPYTQDNHYANNVLYLELLGNGFFYSINYEHLLSRNLSFRIGFSIFPFGNDNLALTFPVLLNYLIGKGNGKFELGLGATFGKELVVYPDLSKGVRKASGPHYPYGYSLREVTFTGVIGYRKQPRNGGLVFRIGIIPIIAGGFFLSGGISIGGIF